MSAWKPGERDYRISAVDGKVHWNEGYCNEACRPVVVIDPEDSRGAAVEIAQSVGSALNVMPGRDISAGIKAAQDAIARLATPMPPKPEEPTGLGAVVDSGPSRYVHVSASVWLSATGFTYTWDDLDGPIRVLSEGVTP